MSQKVTTSKRDWKSLVAKHDPGYERYRPEVYFFAGGAVTKTEPRKPFYARLGES